MYPIRTPWWLIRGFPRIIWTSLDNERLLTFDDGPHPETTPWILDWLDEHDEKAVFFLTGKNAERYPSIMDEIRKRGHTVANHGYLHKHGWRMSVNAFVTNVNRGAEITGSTLFRPPYGEMGWRQYRTIRHEYTVMMWTVLTGDFDQQVNINDRMRYINHNSKPNDILVLHDNPKHHKRCMAMLSLLSQ